MFLQVSDAETVPVREHEIFRDYAGQVLRAHLTLSLTQLPNCSAFIEVGRIMQFRVLESVQSA